MGDSTGIEWTDATWNAVRGCSRTAPAGSSQSGCGDNTGGGCYAERTAARFCGPGKPYEGLVRITARGPRWTGVVRLVPKHLADPMRWKKPRRIFANSMSDLFHEELSNEQIAAVFGVMSACPQHTFQVLTKRAARMREWFAWLEERVEDEAAESGRDVGVSLREARAETRAMLLAEAAADELADGSEEQRSTEYGRLEDAQRDTWARTGEDGGTDWTMPWPLPNVWLGVSVENQAAANERIPDLLATPAAIRFLSCEPLLGPVDLTAVDQFSPLEHVITIGVDRPALDWVIVGCESGPRSRRAEVDWYRMLRDQCAAAGVPYFLKQAVGSHVERCDDCDGPVFYEIDDVGICAAHCGCTVEGGEVCSPVGIVVGPGSHVKGRGLIGAPYLDGKQHLAFPEGRW